MISTGGGVLPLFDSFKDFSACFPEFERISPAPLRAVYVLKEDGMCEVIIDLEGNKIFATNPIPNSFRERLQSYANKHKVKLEVTFE